MNILNHNNTDDKLDLWAITTMLLAVPVSLFLVISTEKAFNILTEPSISDFRTKFHNKLLNETSGLFIKKNMESCDSGTQNHPNVSFDDITFSVNFTRSRAKPFKENNHLTPNSTFENRYPIVSFTYEGTTLDLFHINLDLRSTSDWYYPFTTEQTTFLLNTPDFKKELSEKVTLELEKNCNI